MGDALHVLAGLVTMLFDLLARPTPFLTPAVGLATVSTLCGIPMAEAFRLASPRSLDGLRRSAFARMAGMLLHMDDPRSVLSLALSSLWRTSIFLLALTPPVLLASVPFLVSYGQLEARFGRRMPGDTTVVIVQASTPDLLEEIRGRGAVVLPPVVRGTSPATAAFRVAVEGRGILELDGREAEIGTGTPGMPLPSGFSTRVTAASLLDPSVQILYGSDGGFSGTIGLEPAAYRIAGIRAGWLAIHLACSSIGAIAWYIAAMRRRR